MLAHNDGSAYVGTEHILLGVLAQNSSLGAKILAESGVTLDRAELALNLTAKPLVITVVQRGLSAEVVELIRTSWQLAVEFGQERNELVIWLVEQGLDVNTLDYYGRTPLYKHATLGRDTVKLLYELGGDIQKQIGRAHV